MRSKIFWALTFYIPKIINNIHKNYHNRQKLMTIQVQKQLSMQYFTELCQDDFTYG